MCKFHIVGMCSRGESCAFAHSREELVQQPDFYCTRICPALLRTGVCRAGDHCRHAHTQSQLRKSLSPVNTQLGRVTVRTESTASASSGAQNSWPSSQGDLYQLAEACLASPLMGFRTYNLEHRNPEGNVEQCDSHSCRWDAMLEPNYQNPQDLRNQQSTGEVGAPLLVFSRHAGREIDVPSAMVKDSFRDIDAEHSNSMIHGPSGQEFRVNNTFLEFGMSESSPTFGRRVSSAPDILDANE